MDTTKYIEGLFQKFIEGSLTKEEFITLMEFVRNPESESEVKELLDGLLESTTTYQELINKTSNSESKLLFNQIITQIDYKDQTGKKNNYFPIVKHIKHSNFFKIAASIALAFCLFYVYQINFIEIEETITNDVTLTLDNGEVEIISDDGDKKIKDKTGAIIGSQSGSQITYSNDIINEELVYNTLTVPNGKRFDLVLSDGTNVKLNAGTSLKYPVKFLKGKNRQVFLEGEAYFDVARDNAHAFIVTANDLNVEVLGTEFNMSFYPEDYNISTVLIEGSVKLYEKGKTNVGVNESTMLLPNYLASWNKANREISVKEVDTQIYTAWKDGMLIFRKASYRNIRKKLERHFDIIIDNQYSFLDDQIYTASFDKDETIENILDAFKGDTYFNYRRTNNLITITN